MSQLAHAPERTPVTPLVIRRPVSLGVLVGGMTLGLPLAVIPAALAGDPRAVLPLLAVIVGAVRWRRDVRRGRTRSIPRPFLPALGSLLRSPDLPRFALGALVAAVALVALVLTGGAR